MRKRLLWPLVLLYALPGISVGIAATTGVQFTVPVMAALLFVLSRKRPYRIHHAPRDVVSSRGA